MQIKITFSGFHDAFRAHDRLSGWTYEGLRALYDYLIELEEETGRAYELDVIELDCDYFEVDKDDTDEYNKDSVIIDIGNGNLLVRND